MAPVRVVHQGQSLPLRFEPGQDLARIHPRLDELQRDPALHRLGLFGHPDRAHAALADLLQQFEPPGEHNTRLGLVAGYLERFARRAGERRHIDRFSERTDGFFKELRVVGVGSQQGVHGFT